MRGSSAACESDEDHVHTAQIYSSMDVGLTITAYMFANAGVSIFQKIAITAVPFPLFLVAIQVVATLLLILPFYSTIKLGSRVDMLKFLPMSFCFFLMLTGSMIAYQYCTLGTIVVVGSISPLATLGIERIYFIENRTRLTWHTLASIIITVIGVIMYGLYKSEIEAQALGMIALIAKILVAIYYQTRQRYLMVEDPVSISDTGMMVYNNLVTFLGSVICMIPTGEFNLLPTLNPSSFGIFAIAASCLFCGLIGYIAFRTQRRVSATSFLIIVNVCKIAVVLFGWLVLGEEYNWQSGVACVLVMTGAGWYGWDRRTIESRRQTEYVKVETQPEDFGLLEEAEWNREKRFLTREEQKRDF
eukprot:CAMPEP_0184494856 /NCGR_PEP_ID=MMETSP0113_2-20130426/29742_1 /TAXON_ID=91329 /ORGANISM="Norrisiella sphaerica, Strain BC52" /LENGTH=358 /DNA_ID=CAMNT_0026880767 /DNA_START=90 /DNA_END=1166 /DNA_ORIENTATION=+